MIILYHKLEYYLRYCNFPKQIMMKKYLLFPALIFFVTFSFGQKGFGFDVGFSTSKAPMMDVKYFVNKNAGSIGFSYQVFNDALGKKEPGVIPGTNAIGDGDYFYSVDIGYTRVLNEKFCISGEISIGQKIFYQNLSDITFAQGGYHRTVSKKSEVGGGASLTYDINDNVGIFAGYNSIRQGSLGIQFRFLH